MKKKKIYLIVSFVVIVILAAGAYFLFSGNSSKALRFRTEKASKGSIILQVRATGTVNPVRTVQVGSQVSGTISRINVDFNSVVRRGDVIAVIDSTFLYASVKEAQANVDRVKANVNNSRRAYDRAKELFAKNLISQAELDAAQTAFETDMASSKQTQAALDRAMVNLRYAVIRAPIDGVVISRDVDVGQTVAASLQTPKLFSIAEDLSHMQVEASVDEADIGQIKEGQRVTFTVDAFPDEQFRGSVAQIRLSPVTVQNVVTYTVVIEVPNPDFKLRPGMTATVSILVDRRDNVIRVPAVALRFQPPQEILEKASEQKQQAAQEAPKEGAPSPQIAQVSPGGESPKQGDRKIRQERRSEERQGRDRQADGGRRRMREDAGSDPQSERAGRDQMDGQRQSRRSMDDQAGTVAPVKTGHLWIMENGNPRMIQVTLGLNDNRFVEVSGEAIAEGAEVIIGTMGNETTASGPQGQQNPFMPRMGPPGGGGGRGGR